MEYLQSLDYSIFGILNGSHAEYFDHLMWLIGKTQMWVPMILVLLWLSWRRGSMATVLIVVAIALTVLISDQVSSSIIKPLAARLRPSHDPSLTSSIELVNNYRGGLYGFVSSHAANSVGTASLVIMIFRHRAVTIVMALWAALVSYCRIYEGVHFPGDILGGAVIGLLSALAVYTLYKRIKPRFSRREPLFESGDAKFFAASVSVNLLLVSIIAIFHNF